MTEQSIATNDTGSGTGTAGQTTSTGPIGTVSSMDAATAAAAAQAGQTSGAANDNASASQSTKTGKSGKVIHMPSDALSRIKKEHLDKGMRQAKAEFDKKLKEMGIGSIEELATFKGKAQSTEKPESKSHQPANDNARGNPEHQVAFKQWSMQKKRVLERLTQETKARKRAERERDRMEVIKDLSIAAAQSGIKHIDFAIDMLNKQMKGKNEAEMAAFDEVSFFNGLKNTHPFLFHAEQQFATTGPAGSETSAPAAGSTAAVQKPAIEDKSIDARKLSQDEYQALLRKHGLTNPAAMM
jgi:hypothetical protein